MFCNFSILAVLVYVTLSLALELAFSSLYRDEVRMTENDITSIVAASSMLQMVSGWEGGDLGREGGRECEGG